MGSEAVSGSFPIKFSPYEMEENPIFKNLFTLFLEESVASFLPFSP
jgi:hypothetical protein